jgi:hypothetical protein
MNDHPTCEELCAVLGPNWVIARKTRHNLIRFADRRIISRKEYAAAVQLALRRRGANVVRLSDYR